MSTTTPVAAATPARRSTPRRNDLLVASCIAGGVSGAAALAFVCASASVAGRPAWRPVAAVAATFLGDSALDGGAAAVLIGAAVWLALSAVLAVVYASLIPRDYPYASAAMMGVGYSFLVMALMTTTVLPAVNPQLRSIMPAIGGAWVLGYLLFGVGLGFIPVIRRRLA